MTKPNLADPQVAQRIALISYLAFLVGIAVFVACGGERLQRDEPVAVPCCACEESVDDVVTTE